MFSLLIGGVVGLLVGWNTKQPQFVTDLIAKAKAKLGA